VLPSSSLPCHVRAPLHGTRGLDGTDGNKVWQAMSSQKAASTAWQ
jgi:hypothetical protein